MDRDGDRSKDKRDARRLQSHSSDRRHPQYLGKGASVVGSICYILRQRIYTYLILLWPTSWITAVGGLFVCVCVSVCVCESVCPRTCRHIARCMMNG